MKYLICDMDGTLLNSNKQLPEKLDQMITILKDRNICFGIASGRQYFNLYHQFQAYAKDMLFIAENGGIVYEGETPFYTDEISYDELVPIIERMRLCKGAYPVVCGVKSAYIEVTDPDFVENASMYYHRLQIVDDLIEAMKHDQIAKIAVWDSINSEQNCYPYLKEHTGKLRSVVSGKDWMDISNPSVSKGKAIRVLKEKEQLTSDDFIAFGDFMNDYEMMKECTYSYAMSNAHEELKKVCNFETCSNDEDGVVKGVCSLLNIEYASL